MSGIIKESMEVKMGECQSQNGLEVKCSKCNTVYNTKDGNCPTCNPLVVLDFNKLVPWCSALKCNLTCETPCSISVCAMIKECSVSPKPEKGQKIEHCKTA